jgi:hypothetical protein
MRLILLLIIAMTIAACTASPSTSASPEPSARDETSAPASPTESAAADAEASGTLTLGDFGIADGPGESVASALANAGDDPRLITGIMLKDQDDRVWVCDELTDSETPECAEPRLLVTNYPEDVVEQNGEQYFSIFARDLPDEVSSDLQEVNGVRFVEDAQIFGVVRVGE